MLRIISGERRGRILKTLEGSHTRPTSDRVKESLFNIIQFLIPGSTVLDLFSGSGNLGLEALSRGSTTAVFVEKEPRALAVIKANCQSLDYLDRAELMGRDALRAVEELAAARRTFDIIWMDPPYEKGYEAPVLGAIARGGLLQDHGIIIVEHLATDPPPDAVDGLVKYDCRRYGNTSMSLYRKG